MSMQSPTLAAIITAASLLATASLATAQPGTQPAALQPLPEVPAAAAPVKRGNTATAIAVGTTLAGMALMISVDEVDYGEQGGKAIFVAGLGTALIGPAAGHLYAGEYGHALRTTAARGAAVGAMFGGVVMLLSFCDRDCEDDNDNDVLGATLFYGGAAALVGLTAYDLWDAHKAAGRANARHAIRVTPTALATSHGPVAGLAVGGSF